MINWFNVPDEGLSNGGLFEVKELEVTENGTYETSGEMYNKVIVNVEGGGGSSDFSTAEVTLNAGGFGFLVCASIVDNILATSVAFFIESFEAVLYKGSQVCDTSEIEGTITVSGGAVYDSDEQTITITGDCTITIS